jgi:Ca2+-binding RTX toxin-like protein
MYTATRPSSEHEPNPCKLSRAASRRRPRAHSYSLENLEARQLMSTSVVNGSLNIFDPVGANDRITLDANTLTRDITVNENGRISVFRGITQVNVDGGAGVDAVIVFRTLPNVPTMVNFTQGSATDSVTIGVNGSTQGILGPVTVGALLTNPPLSGDGSTGTLSDPILPGTGTSTGTGTVIIGPTSPTLPPYEIRQGTSHIYVTLDDSRSYLPHTVSIATDASNHLAITGMSPAPVNYITSRVPRVTLKFGGGNDTLNPSIVPTQLYAFGGWGYDRLTGGRGNDELHGDGNDDTLFGGLGRDRLFGEEGVDTLTGVSGEDVLSGGTNNDALNITFNLDSFVQARGASIALTSEYRLDLNGANPNGADVADVRLDLGSYVHSGVIPTLAQVRTTSEGLSRAARLPRCDQHPLFDPARHGFGHSRRV